MSRKAERLAEQREFLRDMETDTSRRLNAETARMQQPAPVSHCLPGRIHYWFRSQRDGKLHCSLCYQVRP